MRQLSFINPSLLPIWSKLNISHFSSTKLSIPLSFAILLHYMHNLCLCGPLGFSRNKNIFQRFKGSASYFSWNDSYTEQYNYPHRTKCINNPINMNNEIVSPSELIKKIRLFLLADFLISQQKYCCIPPRFSVFRFYSLDSVFPPAMAYGNFIYYG